MSHFIAFILGLVEGLTEYLPVSSTGHLILVSHFLGSESEASKSFDIVIQLGAILAVVVHYRALLGARLRGLLTGDKDAKSLALALFIGFLPAGLLGLLLRKTIKAHLFGPLPVAAALLVGGVLMIVIERARAAKGVEGLAGLEHVTPRRALAIGVGQCFALWPGASRSMCTIVAAQMSGLHTSTAAEFSFLLALPTLGAATLYELYKARNELFTSLGASQLWVGLVVSFLVAWLVIAGFIRYLRSRGLEVFGYYRIVLALTVFVVFFALR